MARGGRWFSSFFSGKKEKDKEEEDNKKKGRKQQQQQQQQQQSRSPVPSPGGKEKKRWSFRRPVDATRMKELNSTGADDDQKRHALAVAAATKAAAEAAAAAAQAAAVVIRLTASAKCRLSIVEEVAAATKIQAVFRSYLARKALRALKGIVKLQALIRGQLVRKLVSLHVMDRAHQRALIAKEAQMMMIKMISQGQFSHRRSPSPLDPRCGRTYELDRNLLENIKIIQMDLSGSTWSSRDERKSTKSSPFRYDIRKQQQKQQQQLSSPTSALTDKSEESSFRTSESSPYPYSNSIKENMYLISNNYDLYPNYMAKTASSVAKARSQSTPRQRPASPRRRTSIGSANEAAYQFPWKENFYKSLV